MIQIYHNSRCSKSRNGVAFLKELGKEFEIVKYLDNVPTEATLTKIIKLLKITPYELVRKNEKIWKENFKGKNLTNSEIITVMVTHPKLIERPIIINGNKAVIGRPTENILDVV